MRTITQTTFGFLNNQTIIENAVVVDDKYLQRLLSLPNNPSDTNAVVLALFLAIEENSDLYEKKLLPPEIEKKIEFNNLELYREHIEENYCENAFFIDSAYDALDSDTPGRKNRFLKYINSCYKTIVGNHLKSAGSGVVRMDVIRANADSIFTQVVNNLLLKIASNSNTIGHLSSENIELNVIALVCHAFVDCKVLENPNQREI